MRAGQRRRRPARGRRRRHPRRRPHEQVVGPAGRRGWCAIAVGGGGGGGPRRLGALRAHLDLEEPLGERGLDVVHEVLEHLEGLPLVLHQRVLLAPRPILDGVPQLVEIVQMVLPPLVQHREHHLTRAPGCPRPGSRSLRPNSARYSIFRRKLSSPSAFTASTILSMSGVASASVSASTVTRYCSVSASRRPPRSHSSGCSAAARNWMTRPLERRLDHPPRLGLELLAPLEREQPQRVDHLALLVHHVVVLEQPLPALEVLQLDPLLRLLDGARDQAAGDDLALLGAALVHPARDAVRPEQPHQVVLEREEEDALPRIALAARAAAQLAVDAPRLVPLGADDLEARLGLLQVQRPCRV